MEPDLKKRFMYALQGRPVDRTPVCSVTQTGTVELMDLTGAAWPASHSDPEKMAALALAGHEIAGLEAVRYPYCLTVLAETMGCSVRMGTKDIQPSVLSHPSFASGARGPFRCAQEDKLMGYSSDLRSKGLTYNISDQYNDIRYTKPLLSRSTQESGLSRKK